MKKIIVSVIILVILLAGLTVIFARQDTVLRVSLSEETLVRNGQHLTVYIRDEEYTWHTLQAETPYYSLYEYNLEIPADTWHALSQIRLEFGQVRRGDHIYIEDISVKHPLFKENKADNSVLYKRLFETSSAQIGLTDDNLIDIEVLATRAHTPTMRTEGPSFNLPTDDLGISRTPSLLYVLSMLAVIAVWAVAVFVIPKKIYGKIPEGIKKMTAAVKALGAIDFAIIITGIASLVLYHYASKIPIPNSDSLYTILSFVTILLIFIKWLTRPNEKTAQASHCGHVSDRRRFDPQTNNLAQFTPYITLIALSFIIYLPAIFPNPYYFNDENIVVGAAEWYLYNGDFEWYDRAWPHTWMVAQAISLLGESTASARLVSAIFGVIFIVSAYHIIKKITKQEKIALLSSVLLLCNPLLIDIFTTVRMYAVMLPISLWMFYCIYMTLHREISYKRDNAVTRFITKHFNFHFGYAAATIFLMWLNYEVHANALIIPLCAAVYVFLAAAIKRERKYINLSLIGVGFIILIAIERHRYIEIPLLTPMIRFVRDFTGFGWYNYVYFWENISIPLGSVFGVFFLVVLIILLISTYLKTSVIAASGPQSPVDPPVIAASEPQSPVDSPVIAAPEPQSPVDSPVIAASGPQSPVDPPVIAASEPQSHAGPGYIPFPAIAYSALIYIITVIFFIYFADRYYEYVYMAFLVPVTIMLISAGIFMLTEKIGISTGRSIYALVAAAAIMQLSSAFSYTYIDKPDRSKYDRPFAIIENDAAAEGIDNVLLHATYARRYWTYIDNSDNLGYPDRSGSQIDWLLERIEQPVIHFMSEQSKMFRVNDRLYQFLTEATDFITDIDETYVYKYHFIEPSYAGTDTDTDTDANTVTITDETGGAVRIAGVAWEEGRAYLRCEMTHIPGFDGAVFIAVEAIEQGIAQSAAHRYQVFMPEDLAEGSKLAFTLPVSPKTEEYSENISFGISPQLYIYYGQDEAAVIG